MALVLLIGSFAIVRGVAEVGTAIWLRNVIESAWLYVLSGIVSIVFGAFLIVAPGDGAFAVLFVIGFYALFAGVMYIAIGSAASRRQQDAPHRFNRALAPPPDGPAQALSCIEEREHRKEIEMDFNTQVDDLENRVDQLKASVAAAARRTTSSSSSASPGPGRHRPGARRGQAGGQRGCRQGAVVVGADAFRREGPPRRAQGQGAAPRRPGRCGLRRVRRGLGRSGRLRRDRLRRLGRRERPGGDPRRDRRPHLCGREGGSARLAASVRPGLGHRPGPASCLIRDEPHRDATAGEVIVMSGPEAASATRPSRRQVITRVCC